MTVTENNNHSSVHAHKHVPSQGLGHVPRQCSFHSTSPFQQSTSAILDGLVVPLQIADLLIGWILATCHGQNQPICGQPHTLTISDCQHYSYNTQCLRHIHITELYGMLQNYGMCQLYCMSCKYVPSTPKSVVCLFNHKFGFGHALVESRPSLVPTECTRLKLHPQLHRLRCKEMV